MDMRPLIDDLVCPGCHGPLASTGAVIECTRCERRFPVLGNAVPLLVTDANALVHDAFARLRKLSGSMTKRMSEVAAAASTVEPQRATALRRVRDALAGNHRFLEDVQAVLEPLLSYGAVADAAVGAAPTDPHGTGTEYYELVGGYVRRDWSRQPECEVEVSTIMRSICAALEEHAPRATRVLVLGAGAARFAFELTARVRDVIAIDRSVLMAASVQLLRERPQRLYEVHERNVVHVDDHVRPFDASIPARSENGATFDRMRYVVGDALAAPLSSHSVSAVVSVYFTDVVSPTLLFSEAARLLEPGGLFLHFGPLAYHFTGPRERLSADELTQLMSQCGYEIVDEHWVQLSCLASDLSMLKPQVRNWCMSAVLKGDARCRDDEVREADVLSIRAESLLQARWRRSGTGDRWVDGSVVSMWGHEVALTERVFDVLRLIDGRRTVGELFDVADTTGSVQPDRPAIRNALTQLKRVGVIAVSSATAR